MGLEAAGRAQHILERGIEGDVEEEAQGRRADAPESEHRLTRPTHPEERRTALGHLEGDREPDHVAVEGERPIEVGHGEMGLEQPIDGDGTGAHQPIRSSSPHSLAVSIGRLETRAPNPVAAMAAPRGGAIR